MILLYIQQITFMAEGVDYAGLVGVLREKEKLVINSQYAHDMRSLLISLNSSCIDSIKQEFHLNENKLDLEKFLWLLRRAVGIDKHNYIVYYELTRLFEDIDIDNSRTIEWQQFLEYLSASAWIGEHLDEQWQPLTQDKKILFHVFREASQYRKQPIKKIVELQRHGLLTVINRDNRIEYIDYEKEELSKGEIRDVEETFELQHIDSNRVLSLDYAEEERLFGVLMSNRSLCFIEDGEMQKNLGVMRSSGSEIEIKYLSMHRLWVLENAPSTIQIFPSPKGPTISNQLVFQPHKHPITGINQISTPLAICTSSLDGLVRLWQASTGRLIIELSAKHELCLSSQQEKGVKGMATYSNGSLSYICSWMFTSSIYLWLPSLSLSKPFSGQLKGHLGLVIDCVFTWHGEVVSLDDRRSLRLWNAEKCECIQTLTIEHQASNLLALKGKPYLITYAKLMDFYRVRTNSKADLQAQIGMTGKRQRNVLNRGQGLSSKIIGSYFSPYYSALVVVTTQQAKILQVNSCSLLGTLLPSGEDQQFIGMTAKGTRRLYLASSLGCVYQHKIQNGMNVKSLSVIRSSEDELMFLYYHQQTNMLMVVIESGVSSFVVTFDEQAGNGDPIKQIEFEQTELNCFCFSLHQQRFFILSDRLLTIWSYDKLAMINKINMDFVGEQVVLDMVLEERSGSILLVCQKEIFLMQIDEYGMNSRTIKLLLPADWTVLIGGGLLCERVSDQYLHQLRQSKKVKVPVSQKAKESHKKEEQPVVLATTSEVFILYLSNSHHQSFPFNITSLLPPAVQARPMLRGKVQRIKENRKSYLSECQWVEIQDHVSLDHYFFTEKSIVVPKSIQAGTAAGHFYVLTDHKTMHLYDVFARNKGEWNLSLPRPKKWAIAHNKLDQILDRLDRTEEALKRIHPLPHNKLKIELLLSKYITADDLKNLESKNRIKSSQNQIWPSKKTIKFLPAAKEEEEVNLHQFQWLNTNSSGNIFAKKLEARQSRHHLKSNSVFFEKVQHSLKMRPFNDPSAHQISAPVPGEKVDPFVQQMQYLFACKTGGSVKNALDESSAKSKKKEPRKLSTANDRPQSSVSFKNQFSQGKSRVKSSLTDLTKNFFQNKVACEHFLSANARIISAATSSLQRRCKLKL